MSLNSIRELARKGRQLNALRFLKEYADQLRDDDEECIRVKEFLKTIPALNDESWSMFIPKYMSDDDFERLVDLVEACLKPHFSFPDS
ncbi:MAG: hypothetical protein OWQ54_02825 [Sulfolobaceae archaeon]|nr:hypothetical protein [Sulfolobaceae archaeon]